MTIADQARQTAEELRSSASRIRRRGLIGTAEAMIRAANQLKVLAGAYTTAAAHQCECAERFLEKVRAMYEEAQ